MARIKCSDTRKQDDEAIASIFQIEKGKRKGKHTDTLCYIPSSNGPRLVDELSGRRGINSELDNG